MLLFFFNLAVGVRQVLSNFLSLVEENTEVESVQMVVCRTGALDCIVASIKSFVLDTTVVRAGLDALCNVLADVEASEEVAANSEMIELIVNVMQSNDWAVEVKAERASVHSAG